MRVTVRVRHCIYLCRLWWGVDLSEQSHGLCRAEQLTETTNEQLRATEHPLAALQPTSCLGTTDVTCLNVNSMQYLNLTRR